MTRPPGRIRAYGPPGGRHGRLVEYLDMRRLALLASAGCWSLLLGACGDSVLTTTTGVGLEVRFDSTMPLARISVKTTLDGKMADSQDLPVSPTVGPPGTRVVRIDLPLPEAPGGAVVAIRVDGFADNGAQLGTGVASVALQSGVLVPAVVVLGPAVVCGDGQVGRVETCDDGNAVPGDGCDATCRIEPGWSCAGAPSHCALCGDGVHDPLAEQCDDGNLIDGDGCSKTCRIEGAPPRWLFEQERLDVATTISTVFMPVEGGELSFTPDSAGERFLIFASGVLESSSGNAVAAEFRLMVNGVEVDRVGQQTVGVTDNGAGFVALSYHEALDTTTITVSPEFVSHAGTTRLSQLRVVAARLPPEARVEAFQANAALERTGREEPLGALSFFVDTPARWWVLGKLSATEEPGGGTVRTWFEGPGGARSGPFVNARDAWAPAFFTNVFELPAGQVAFELRGTSGGTGSRDDWWSRDYLYRRTVDPPGRTQWSALAGSNLRFRLNHENLVRQGRSRSNGSDVRVIYQDNNGPDFELHRVLDFGGEWNESDTRLWFRVPDRISNSDDIYVYYGNPSSGEPRDSEREVFALVDGFSSLSRSRWTVTGNASVRQGRLRIPPGASVISTQAFDDLDPRLRGGASSHRGRSDGPDVLLRVLSAAPSRSEFRDQLRPRRDRASVVRRHDFGCVDSGRAERLPALRDRRAPRRGRGVFRERFDSGHDPHGADHRPRLAGLLREPRSGHHRGGPGSCLPVDDRQPGRLARVRSGIRGSRPVYLEPPQDRCGRFDLFRAVRLRGPRPGCPDERPPAGRRSPSCRWRPVRR